MPSKPTIGESSEDALLRRLAPYLAHGRVGSYSITVGDDAAVRGTDGESLVLTTDSLVENVHFDLAHMDLGDVGYKAMVVNLSDCAAMGAAPDGALVELVVPLGAAHSDRDVRALYRGFARACRRWDFPIVGGNIAGGPCWMVSITLIGCMPPKTQPLRRTAARPGQSVWVSGPTGLSAAGLAVLRNRTRGAVPRCYNALVSRHVRPRPQLAFGEALARDPAVACAMDISDGLSVDCARMARASGVGIVLFADTLRATAAVRRLARELDVDPEEWVLHGGEDYELLFTAPPERDFAGGPHAAGVRPRCIGETRAEPPGVFVSRSGVEEPLGVLGWDHLKSVLPSPHQRS
ncbi:MAG: thiamine-phosphate kinase [Chitinivibrionales bacterium]|nr:thiamine-phosphate kinase [Chitinivibrionales bacterium]